MADIGEYIGNGNPDGTSFGYDENEKISFYGVTPCTQQSGGTAIATTALPTTVATVTTGSYGFTTTTDGATLLALVTAMQATLNVVVASLKTNGLLS